MDFLKNAFDEALQTNYNETIKWNKYKTEYEELINNLKYYQKFSEVPIMVPVGGKALLPGYLYHTNEILINHYCDYFSKCTTEKSLEICQLRIKLANGNLEKLRIEEEMYRNKQDLPLQKEAFMGGDGDRQEIIEPYDEEIEKQWRIEHKKRLYDAKQQEKKEKLNEKSDEKPIESILNELEMIEELENEFENLEIDKSNELLLNKIVCGEIPLPEERKRVSNYVEKVAISKDVIPEDNSLCSDDDEEDDEYDYEDSDLNNLIQSPEMTNDFKKLLIATKTLQIKEKLKIFESGYKNLVINILETNLSNPYIQMRSKKLITAVLINEEIFKMKEQIKNNAINANSSSDNVYNVNKKVKFSDKIETKTINRENDVKLVHHINKVIKNNLKYKLDEHFLDDTIIQIKIKHTENIYKKNVNPEQEIMVTDCPKIETPDDIYEDYIKNKLKYKKELKSILKETNYNLNDFIINKELSDNDSDDVIVECFDDEDDYDVVNQETCNKVVFKEIIGDVIEHCDKSSNVATTSNCNKVVEPSIELSEIVKQAVVTESVVSTKTTATTADVTTPTATATAITTQNIIVDEDNDSKSNPKKVSLFKKSRIL